MSNAAAEFMAFKRRADRDPGKTPHVVVVNGALGGWDAIRTVRYADEYVAQVDERLALAGLTARQVEVVWLKQAIAGERAPFPDDARRLQGALSDIVGVLQRHFAHLQLVYLSSRTYAGYASTPLNPEPAAYDSGFAVRWVIEDRIRTAAPGAWVAWGPYLWTNGTTGRSDGLVWTCGDVAQDGTHPSETGAQKIASLLWAFFTTDQTTAPWFLRR